MFFSVIIPLYNKADFIQAALQSVLDQRHQDFEVIVVDDGSTDDGPQRVAAIGDSRLRLLRQSNMGVSAARNRGVREATGDYVAFLDADDYWTPGYLSAIVEMIGQFPECGMYATHWYRFNEDKYRQVPKLWGIRAGVHPQRIDRFFEIWSHGNFFCTDSVVIPVRILRDCGIRFPEGEQRGEDQEVWFRIAERWSIAYLAQPLVGYRMGVAGSLTITYPEEILPYLKRLRMRYRSLDIPYQHRKGVSRILGVAQINIARRLLLRGKRSRAITVLCDPLCLRAPRYWLRVFLTACMPGWLSRRIVRIDLDRFHTS